MSSPASDRRFRFANDRVAFGAVQVVPMRVSTPLADLCRAPGQGRDRQLLFGEPVEVLEQHKGHAFLRLLSDGYVGYVGVDALANPAPPATHRINARSSHIYTAPDLKAPEVMALPHGALLSVAADAAGHVALATGGHVPAQHVTPLNAFAEDPAMVAEAMLGAPYLWGGDSAAGVDCSGLVLAACRACGIDCPRDSDLQQQSLGALLPDDAPARRGDLLFWKGHVAMMLDEARLIHANAHHMAVAIEPAAQAIARIGAREFGALTARRRLVP